MRFKKRQNHDVIILLIIRLILVRMILSFLIRWEEKGTDLYTLLAFRSVVTDFAEILQLIEKIKCKLKN